jgi:hypothetical protein
MSWIYIASLVSLFNKCDDAYPSKAWVLSRVSYVNNTNLCTSSYMYNIALVYPGHERRKVPASESFVAESKSHNAYVNFMYIHFIFKSSLNVEFALS